LWQILTVILACLAKMMFFSTGFLFRRKKLIFALAPAQDAENRFLVEGVV
jgi:hypothetical protein